MSTDTSYHNKLREAARKSHGAQTDEEVARWVAWMVYDRSQMKSLGFRDSVNERLLAGNVVNWRGIAQVAVTELEAELSLWRDLADACDYEEDKV